MIKEILKKLIARQDLHQDEASGVMEEIMSGNCTSAQVGAFLAALACKGETFSEVTGSALTLRRRARRINTTSGTVVDTCGTGGDGADTFNISTTAAFVVAGCGVTVAKHGNRSVSSRCGSADLLEELGVPVNVDPEVTEEVVEQVGIGFLFAPLYHKAMKHAAGPRRETGFRSIFNMLGPLINPAGANCQLLGVYDPVLTQLFAQTLRELGSRHCLVVHGMEGLDEISICGPTRISRLREGLITTYEVTPEQLTGRRAEPWEIKGGDPPDNARNTMDVLEGKLGPCRDVVTVNTAGALMVAGMAKNFSDGIKMAEESIDQGRAMRKLQDMTRYLRENS